MSHMRKLTGLASFVLFVLLTLGASGLAAQNTTGTIRGRVVNDAGQGVVGASVRLLNAQTGAVRQTLTNESGAYALVGVPPATYELSVDMIGYGAQPQTVRMLIGQSLSVDIALTPQALRLEGIVATTTRGVETRTPEVATNVTEEQMRSLPQADRNFLNFATLAPGITVSRDENNKQLTAGGLPATKINVFIDGASYKNDMLEGGLHGQDASKGNPFPQIALQEFRVVTQNFKAEYQRAASAVITATTRSGTNDFQLNGFVTGQNKSLVERDPGSRLDCADLLEANPDARCAPKPEYERLQFGLSAGGPIQRDRLHYFLAFEGNYQNRERSVDLGGLGDTFGGTTLPFTGQTFASYTGVQNEPFRSSLGVAKLSYVPAANQTLELAWHTRVESDRRDFGGTTSFESATNMAIRTNVVNLQHTLTRGNWFNQAQVSGQRAQWNPTQENSNAGPALFYENLLRVGGFTGEQDFKQDRISLRNDLSHVGMTWNGSHAIKMGANVDFLSYSARKLFWNNPGFFFNPQNSLTVPFRAQYGSGDPGIDENNVQFGLYIQDDWDVTDRLQLNLGVRWDAETNQFNNAWVTPDSIRQRFAGFGYDNRFTSGRSDRPMFLGAFQPRVGFSFDVRGDARTVLHGGAGLYYDREVWNHLLDESRRLRYVERQFFFSEDGSNGTIVWDPSYLSREGLEGLIAQGTQPLTSEVFLLENDTRPPRSLQWSAGIRQAVSVVLLGATYRGVRGYNLLSWYCGMPSPVHGYCTGGRDVEGLPYDPVLSSDEGRSWYDAVDLTAERPFSELSRWGFTLSYTYADASRQGFDFFTLDHPGIDPSDWPKRRANVEKHRVVASGIVALPYDVRLSTITQLGSGVPYNRTDELNGWGPARAVISYASEDAPNFRQVDLRLEKGFDLRSQGRVGLSINAINVFDHDNFRGYEGFYRWDNGTINPNFGTPQRWTADPGRRVELGLNFEF